MDITKEKKQAIKWFLKESFLYLATQAVGLLFVFRVARNADLREVVSSSGGEMSNSPLHFLIYLAVATAIILLVIKLFKRSGTFFKVLFVIALIGGIDASMGVLIGEPWAFLLAVGLVGLRVRYKKIYLHNLVIILAVGGAAPALGFQFSPLSVVVILIALALYDIVAVYFTKHMVKMAREMASKDALFAIVVPKGSVQDHIPRVPQKVKAGGNFMVLGAGDLAIPLMLSSSVAGEDFLGGIIVALFSFLGLVLMHFVFITQDEPKPMPALPPICVGALLGYFIVLLL